MTLDGLTTTTNVDLAAYLHLSGLAPDRITLDRSKYIHFHYRPTEYFNACVQAFQSDAMVPVRAYAEARQHMKELAGQAVQMYPESRRLKSLRRAQ